MHIAGVSVAYPSRVVTNAQVLDMIRDASPNFEGDLDHTLRRTGALLRATGLRARRWLAAGETPVDLTIKACREALEKSDGRKPTLVIYGAVFPLLASSRTCSDWTPPNASISRKRATVQ